MSLPVSMTYAVGKTEIRPVSTSGGGRPKCSHTCLTPRRMAHMVRPWLGPVDGRVTRFAQAETPRASQPCPSLDEKLSCNLLPSAIDAQLWSELEARRFFLSSHRFGARRSWSFFRSSSYPATPAVLFKDHFVRPRRRSRRPRRCRVETSVWRTTWCSRRRVVRRHTVGA